MRGQPGPSLAFGNYPAARRYVRGRKPPPIIPWSIGIITCLLFIGAIAMLTVGYLNPYGTVGLAILGVGAVVYFGAILFLVLSCLWMERKYPGMQPLSFKIYSRKQNRMPPTTFANPNISGQMPVDTTPNYRTHTELPIQVPGFNDEGGTTDTSQEDPASHGSSPDHAKNPKAQSTALDILKEEDHNGGISEEDNPDITLHAQTNNENINLNEQTRANLISTAEMEKKSQSQQEQLKTDHGEGAAETHDMDQNKTAQHKQNENGNNLSASLKRERKVKFKTHHTEVPFDHYPLSDRAASLSNKNNRSQEDIQEANSEHISTSTENEYSPTTGASKYPSSTKTSTKDKQKEAPSSLTNLSHTSDNHPHQRTKTAALSPVNVKDAKQESLNPSSTHKSRFIKEDGKLQDGPQSTSSSQPAGSSPVQARKLINHQERLRGLTPTNSASPPAVGKVIEHESHASKPTHSVPKDSAVMPKSSPLSARKLLDVHKNNATKQDHTQESVQGRSQISSSLNTGENMLPQKDNLRHDQQNMKTSLKHRTQNPGSPHGSPTRTQKVQSPERARKLTLGDSVLNSPSTNSKSEGSVPAPRHHQNRMDDFSISQRTQEQSITIQTFSSSGRKEEIQNKKILYSPQSNDFPSSSSSSPTRKQQRSPNRSLRMPRSRDHASRTTAFDSSARNEDFSNMQSHHSSTSSSSDAPASPSLRRTPQNPDLSTTMQRHNDIPVTNVLSSSNNKKDELHNSRS